MPRKYKNIKMQLNDRINSLLRIGESRHQAKQEYKEYCQNNNIPWNPTKTVGIHSIATVEAYRQTANEFGEWMKIHHKEVKDLNNIDKSIAYEYLKERESKGNSAWTVSKDMSALNKCLDLGLNKREGDLKERSFSQIQRSREAREYDTKYNAANYPEQILIAKAFGVRRESIYGGNYQIKDISLYKKDDSVFIRVIEKGGRYRETECLNIYKDEILKTFDIKEGETLTKKEYIDIYNSSSEYLFDRYTNKIDNHAFRAEYANLKYQELAENKENLDESYKGYDKELILQLSQELGHNRLNVVLDHYLKRR